MSHLYGHYATHPTRADCALKDLQDTLIASRNPEGWGVGIVDGETIRCYRQINPAGKPSSQRTEALAIPGTVVLSHVRLATTSEPQATNTQPFRHGASLLVHAGHIGGFDTVRSDMQGALHPSRREAIQGDTDSEYLLQLLLERQEQVPTRPMHKTVRAALQNVLRWSRTARSPAPSVLTLLWMKDTHLAGARFDGPLWYLERRAPLYCPRCGHPHARPPADSEYRAIVFASEPLTDEDWKEVPNRFVFSVTEAARLVLASLSRQHTTPLRSSSTG